MVEIPVWALVLVLVFAAVTALDRVLVPSIRWFFRRRLERAVVKLNKRLAVPIQPFKLARRTDTIRRLRYDPEVAQAIVEHAKEYGIPEDVAAEKAERYAREIVPSFSAFTYFSFAMRVARFLSRALYRVRVSEDAAAKLETLPQDATVIFVMNHRSNMDYVLVTWLASSRTALAYAVGEWARVWPLRPLIRWLGGYFIRRRHNNPLYRKVLARYVKLATEAGVTQAVFPEGGLSRTGALRAPKLGLLSYIVDGFVPGESRDVVFVPVALNYDRVMEDRNLVRAQTEGSQGFRFSLKPIWRYLRRLIWDKITRRAHRYGTAGVAFGESLSLSEFTRAHGGSAEGLGEELMGRIAAVMPVVAFPVIAHAIQAGLRHPAVLVDALQLRLAYAEAQGHTVFMPKRSPEFVVQAALQSLKTRGILRLRHGEIVLEEEGAQIIAFYAASVAPVFDGFED